MRRGGLRRVRRQVHTQVGRGQQRRGASSSRSRARAASSCRRRAGCARVAEWCREHGILLIADEIQTGFCRTGDWFACDHEGVVPDLITTAKGIAGGLPLAGRDRPRRGHGLRPRRRPRRHLRRQPGRLRRRARARSRPCEARTCRARAREIEAALPAAARARCRAKYDLVGDVRGRGAMLAVELVSDGPGPDARRRARRRGHQACHGAGAGDADLRHLRQRVPLPAAARRSRDDLLAEGLDVFEAAFAEAVGGHWWQGGVTGR